MKQIHEIKDLRKEIKNVKSQSKTVGFVPTMGALHDGHRALIERAVKECDYVVVSIFVNPTQFEPGSDYSSYPRTLESDLNICESAGVDMIFAPSVDQMYPEQNLTWVDIEKMTDVMCGKYRAGHFKGVTTVCSKLFNIVNPDKAYFGKKDAQQFVLIKKMIKDLNFPLEIVPCKTVREADGLAMSSRNKYLSPEQRKQAPLIYASLQLCELLIEQGEKNIDFLKKQMTDLLNKGADIKLQYIEFVDIDTLTPLKKIDSQALVAVAVYLGKSRLIDNIVIETG